MNSQNELHHTQNKRKIFPWIAIATFHGLGIVLLSTILFVPFVTPDTLSLYFEALSNPTFASANLKDILIHIGLVTCLWILAVILFQLWDLKRKETTKHIRATRGAVLVETLIVMGPFLLLTSGIAQLTILNITGTLAQLASYQATRTVWVWQPEANKGRKGANNAMVDRRARLAAAAVMAPAAPADFIVPRNTDEAELNDLRGSMTGAFMKEFDLQSGTSGKDKVDGFLKGGNAATDDKTGFAIAFDTAAFPNRAARKLTFAYASTTLKVSASRDTVTTNMQYKQNIVFPWFAYIWGTKGDVGGRGGYYITLIYEFNMPAQVDL